MGKALTTVRMGKALTTVRMGKAPTALRMRKAPTARPMRKAPIARRTRNNCDGPALSAPGGERHRLCTFKAPAAARPALPERLLARPMLSVLSARAAARPPSAGQSSAATGSSHPPRRRNYQRVRRRDALPRTRQGRPKSLDLYPGAAKNNILSARPVIGLEIFYNQW